MFGIGYSELLVIGIIGLIVIGPKDLPRVMREVHVRLPDGEIRQTLKSIARDLR